MREIFRLILLCLLENPVAATPNVNLPLNAQVPRIARVDQEYNFSFSDSTLVSSAGPITYTISNPPRWLALNGPTRMLSGIPGLGDIGSVAVNLSGTDSTGSTMFTFTLVVTEDRGPTNGLSVTEQLPAFGAFSSPNSIILSPLNSLSISLSEKTFANTNENTVYYATSADHTPLPSWIHFDSSSLSFSGTAPQATSAQDATQRFGVELLASNFVGFADAVFSFAIVVESHLLAFQGGAQMLNVSAGQPVSDDLIAQTLLLDGRQLIPADIKNVSATAPTWLSVDRHTLKISGIPPLDFRSQTFTVTVTNGYGDSASTNVSMQSVNTSNETLLDPIGAVDVTKGSELHYDIGKMIIDPNTNITVDLGTASAFLKYDMLRKEITGLVPAGLKSQQLILNITAEHSGKSQSEFLTIAVQDQLTNPTSGATEAPSAGSPVGTNADTNPTSPTGNSSNLPLQRRLLPAIIVPTVLLIATVCTFALIWRRRRRKRQQEYLDECKSSPKNSPSPTSMLEDMSRAKGSGAIGQNRGSKLSLPHRISHISLFETFINSKRVSKDRSSQSQQGRRLPSPDFWGIGFTGRERSFQPETEKGLSNHLPDTIHALSTNGQTSASQRRESSRDFVQNPSLRTERSFGALKASGFFDTNLAREIGHGKPSLFPSWNTIPPRTTNQRIGEAQSAEHSGYGLIKKSWRNLKEKASNSDQFASIAESSSNASRPIPEATIRHVLPSSSASRRSTNLTPETEVPRLHIPKSRRERQSRNPFISGSPGSVHGHRFRQTRSRSSSVNPPMTPTPIKHKATGSYKPRYLEHRIEPRVTSVQEGYAESSSNEKNPRFESPMSSQYLEHNPEESIVQTEVQAGLSATDEGYRRQRDTMTAWASSLALEFEDDHFMGDDSPTVDIEGGSPVDVRWSTGGRRVERHRGLSEGDPANRSVKGEIRTSESTGRGTGDSKRSESSSFL